MPTLRELLSLLGDFDGTLSLIVLCVGGFVWARPRIVAWWVTKRASGLEREITSLERLSLSPSARAELTQQRVFWIFGVIGAWMLVQSMLVFPNSAPLIALGHWFAGSAVYLISLDTLAQMKRMRNAASTVEGLRRRLENLQRQQSPSRGSPPDRPAS